MDDENRDALFAGLLVFAVIVAMVAGVGSY